MTDTTTAARGFGTLPCPHCQTEQAIVLHLDDATPRCGDCVEEIDLGEMRKSVNSWLACLDWLDKVIPMIPPLEE